MPAVTFTFTQNDVKPIVIQNVSSSTGAALTAAVCTLLEHATGDTVGATDNAMTVTGSTIASPNFTWDTLGAFTLKVRLTFADGIVDNSIVAYISVLPTVT